MNIKAVIDTNVLVSAFLTKNRESPTARILDALLTHAFTPLYTPEIIAEYREVFNRPQFGFDAGDIEKLLNVLIVYGEPTDPIASDETFPDPDDKVFYCVALAKSDEKAKLVTGNVRHYPKSVFVLTLLNSATYWAFDHPGFMAITTVISRRKTFGRRTPVSI